MKTAPKPTVLQLQRQCQGKRRSLLIAIVAVVSLTSATGHHLYNQPKLSVGKLAPNTIRVPDNAEVEDIKATADKRLTVLKRHIPVLKFNQEVNQQINQDLQQILDGAEELRSFAGSFPFAETSALSTASQRYLRIAAEKEWQEIVAILNKNPAVIESQFSTSDPIAGKTLKPLSVQAVKELQSYRRLKGNQAYLAMLGKISQSRQLYTRAVAKLRSYTNHQNSVCESLVELSPDAWMQTKTGIRQAAIRILAQGIPPGLPDNILKQAVSIQIQSLVPPKTEILATELLIRVLRPNLEPDQEQTQKQAAQAAQAVPPQKIKVRRGEVIVYAGEEITERDFLLLDYFGLSKRGINWLGLLQLSGLTTGAVGIFCLVETRFSQYKQRAKLHLRRRDYVLVLLLSLSTPLLATFGVKYTNLPAIGWLVGSFYGPTLGVTVVSLVTGLESFSIQAGWNYLLAGAAGGVLAAILSGRMRSREELAFLGSGVGLTQGIVYLLINLIISASAGTIHYAVLTTASLYGLYGLAWSIVAIGISPYLEHLFDLVTPIRLAELANPNRSLLKKLAAKTPGTFQHTLSVANLAQAAARELGCNVELVRAGTLYHDIGKMHDPLGFIENQMGEPNKHDAINDPWKSVEIIKKHVTEGLVMARKHRLPKAIQAFIPEHQGTILIAYFHHQAQQLAEKDSTILVQESDFRYAGPIPQSRETAIVMLADACEAALRSVKDATPESALVMINKIFRARWQDNQLVDSGLKREELTKIAEIFVQVWQQSNHQRIPYPQANSSLK
ncbi:MAG TPA: HDIG domain-containing metalloprotein [Oculatellaceae cyanobacterium]